MRWSVRIQRKGSIGMNDKPIQPAEAEGCGVKTLCGKDMSFHPAHSQFLFKKKHIGDASSVTVVGLKLQTGDFLAISESAYII